MLDNLKSPLEVPHAVPARMADEVVRPVGGARRVAVVGLRPRAERLQDLAMNRAVVRDDRARRATMPALEQQAVLPIDREAAQTRIARLAAYAAERLPLPLDDVRERVLGEPPLPLDPCARAESRDHLAQAPLAESADDAVKRAIFRLDPSDRVALRMPLLHHRMSP